MSKLVNNIRSLHNPLCIAGVAMLAMVRGTAFIASSVADLPLDDFNYAPSLPGIGPLAMGVAWMFAGVFLALSMAVRRLFLTASALMVGMYSTAVVLYSIGVAARPDWDTVVSLSVYMLLVLVMIALASIEVDPPAEPSIGEGEAT